ncbi:MAG: hypothetical protein ACREX7_06170, partial [Casimicrobiaceae bacterium]
THVLAKIDAKLDQLPLDKIGGESVALLAELRATNQKLAAVLDDPALKRLPADADAAVVQLRKTLDDPNLAKAVAHLQSTLSRLDRLTGSGEPDLRKTLDNLRQITENLRDLSENAKRYPSQILLGAPPPPAKGIQP